MLFFGQNHRPDPEKPSRLPGIALDGAGRNFLRRRCWLLPCRPGHLPGHHFNSRRTFWFARAEWGLLLDFLSTVLMLLVSGIGTLGSRLLDGLHESRRRAVPLLRRAQFLRGDDADSRAGEQLLAAVCRVGRRRLCQLSADRFLSQNDGAPVSPV